MAKLPIEFITLDNIKDNEKATDIDLVVDAINLPENAIYHNLHYAKSLNSIYLDLIQRLNFLISNYTKIEDSYENINTEFKEVEDTIKIVVKSINTSKAPPINPNNLTIESNILRDSSLRLEMGIIDKSQESSLLLDYYSEHNEEFNDLLKEKGRLTAAIYAVDPDKYSIDIENHTDRLVQIENSITDVLKEDDTAKVSVYTYNLKSLLLEVIDTYNAVNASYLLFKKEQELLDERLKEVLVRCEKLYVNMLNADYIRSGDFVRVRKENNNIIVSAWKVEEEPCPQPQPLFMPPEVIVHENTATCPPSGIEPEEPEPTTEEPTTTSMQPVCNQNPTDSVNEKHLTDYVKEYNIRYGEYAPVTGLLGVGYDGYLLYVQPDILAGAKLTKYLMLANLTVEEDGKYDFQLLADNNFEFYIDCTLVYQGNYGAFDFFHDLKSGVHQFILRYQEYEGETPCFAGFKMMLNGNIIYATRASDWKGQANSIGEIEWIK